MERRRISLHSECFEAVFIQETGLTMTLGSKFKYVCKARKILP